MACQDRLAWHNLLVLAIGAILTTRSLVRSKRRAAIASVALSYEIFLPLAVAGFGIKSGFPHLWPDGLVVFVIHLALAAIIGTITLVFLGFRPLTLFGYTLGGVAALGIIVLLIGLSGAGAAYCQLPHGSRKASWHPCIQMNIELSDF